MNALQRWLSPTILCCLAACTTPSTIDESTIGPETAAELVAEFAEHDVVLFGEIHDSDRGHRLEHLFAQQMLQRRRDVVISMEMFERDVQKVLDDYLAGRIDEETFKKDARAWPGYDKAYRPIVELAKQSGIRVLAANVPRDLARKVAREGIGAASGSPLAAASSTAPRDDYWVSFQKAMTGDEPAAMPEAALWSMYVAQCLKDDTMAETIEREVVARKGMGERPLVVHYCGAFHVTRGLGTAERLEQRLPGAKIGIVSMSAPADVAAQSTGGIRHPDFVVVVTDGDQGAAERKSKAHPHFAAASSPHGRQPAEEGASGERPGLGLMPVYESTGNGMPVAMVREDGPAAAAGIQAGDTMVKLGGREVTDASTYTQALEALTIGQTVEVELLRDGKPIKVQAKVGKSRR